jgi:hypothetical protein
MNRMFFEWFSPLLLAFVTSLTLLFVFQDDLASGNDRETVDEARHALYPNLTVDREETRVSEHRQEFLRLMAKISGENVDRLARAQAHPRANTKPD